MSEVVLTLVTHTAAKIALRSESPPSEAAPSIANAAMTASEILKVLMAETTGETAPANCKTKVGVAAIQTANNGSNAAPPMTEHGDGEGNTSTTTALVRLARK